ncbi:MAG: pyridoxal phosphate-dependent aminotransferase [Oscillospiraceae bacterium]|nr:pyridoxal phosphate-dependent aminotransferase [Oscillospiraceae bacterium]
MNTVKAYDFDKVTDRRHSDSVKWDVGENELPMWIADMDFPTAPSIIEAIKTRADHGIYGYTEVPSEWYDCYINWWKSRHGFEIKKEWLVYCAGAIPAISSSVRKLSTPAEKVLIQSPVYNMFYNSTLNNGRVIIDSPLGYNKETGEFYIDFEDLEEKLSDPQTTLMILCNPHNPVGRIWTKDELAKIGELCYKHHVTVISDEIHCDIVEPGKHYTPFASASDICREISITCVAPTKCFNIAGIQTSAIIIPNEAIRNRVIRAINTDEVAEPDTFSVCTALAAFNEGGQWLDDLMVYIDANRHYCEEYVEKNIPDIKLIKADATYLLWVDCSDVTDDSLELEKFIREKTGLYVCAGTMYGGSGKYFLRINIACPRSLCEDGMARLKAGIEQYKISG